jgi:Predicted metal-binding protein related to the C-terminal domain of SecA
MGKIFVDNTKTANTFDGEKRARIFAVKKTAKLGTEKNPAVVRVQTEEKMKEVATLFEENNWKYTIGLEPDQPEDITDLERLLSPLKPTTAGKKVGRNEPCPCGSGKKYKKCCGK